VGGTESPLLHPDLCRQSWVSYVQQDIKSVTDWRRNENTVLSLEQNHATKTIESLVTKTRTRVATVWGPVASQCDGYPRVTSVRHNITTIMENETFTTYLLDRPSPTPLSNPWFQHFKPFPNCTFQSEDCPASWEKFKKYFSNWTIPLKDVAPDEFSLGCLDRSNGDVCPRDDRTILDFSSWIALRGYLALQGFFGNCLIPESACLPNWQTIEAFYGKSPHGSSHGSMRQDVDLGCDVTVERFVLIHFPVASGRGQNMCNNSTVAAKEQNLSRNMNTILSTATLSSIIFEAKSSLFGHADRLGLDIERFGYQQSSKCYPSFERPSY
jgi:hypothetical protein